MNHPAWEDIQVRSDQRERWQRCEVCGDSRISGGSYDTDGTETWQQVSCVCGSQWTECYTATRRTNVERATIGLLGVNAGACTRVDALKAIDWLAHAAGIDSQVGADTPKLALLFEQALIDITTTDQDEEDS